MSSMGLEPVNSNKKTGSHAVDLVPMLDQPPSLAATAPQSGFNWIYIQTGKNPVLSQVGCGSREPQINLKENKKLKKLFHFLFSAHDQGNFWIFFLCKSVI